ncbi:hypothetical protein BDN71DRAFT_1444093, partial [Pleurotus eryngii]
MSRAERSLQTSHLPQAHHSLHVPRYRLHFLHFDAPHLTPYVLEVHVLWGGGGNEPASWVTTCFGSLKNLSRLCVSDSMSMPIRNRRPPRQCNHGLIVYSSSSGALPYWLVFYFVGSYCRFNDS